MESTLSHGSSTTRFECNDCGETFAAKRSLLRHRRSAVKCSNQKNTLRRHHCPYCKDTFARHDNAVKHIRRTHANIQQSYSSSEPQKESVSTPRMNRTVPVPWEESDLSSVLGRLDGSSACSVEALAFSSADDAGSFDWTDLGLLPNTTAMLGSGGSFNDTIVGPIDQLSDLHGNALTEYIQHFAEPSQIQGSLPYSQHQQHCANADHVLLRAENMSDICAFGNSSDAADVCTRCGHLQCICIRTSRTVKERMLVAIEQNDSRQLQALLKQYDEDVRANEDIFDLDANLENISDAKYAAQVANLYSYVDTRAAGRDLSMELVEAVYAGSAACVQLLLNRGTPANSAAILFAAEAGNRAVMDLLLENVRIWQLEPESLCPALRAAACNGHVDIVQALLLAGAKVDSPASDGSTALDFASKKSHLQVIELLFEWGATVQDRRRTHNGPISAAIQAGSAKIVDMLLRRAYTTSAQLESLFVQSILQGSTDVVRVLLQFDAFGHEKTSTLVRLLRLALQCGHYGIIRVLLDHQPWTDLLSNFGIDFLYALQACKDSAVVGLFLSRHRRSLSQRSRSIQNGSLTRVDVLPNAYGVV